MLRSSSETWARRAISDRHLIENILDHAWFRDSENEKENVKGKHKKNYGFFIYSGLLNKKSSFQLQTDP